MTALMLIGLVPGEVSSAPEAPPHTPVMAEGWTAIALDVALSAEADAATMLDWAARQNAVLAAYVTRFDVLPVALGSIFSGPHALRDHIRAENERLKAEAERFEGLCEYSLHVAEAGGLFADHADPATDGRSFLRARQSRRNARATRGHDRAALLSEILDLLRTHSHEIRDLNAPEPDRILDYAILLPRKTVAALIDKVTVSASRADALGLSCRMVGPCPAYSFVTQDPAHV